MLRPHKASTLNQNLALSKEWGKGFLGLRGDIQGLSYGSIPPFLTKNQGVCLGEDTPKY